MSRYVPTGHVAHVRPYQCVCDCGSDCPSLFLYSLSSSYPIISPCPLPSLPASLPLSCFSQDLAGKYCGLKSLSEFWKAFYYLPKVTCLCNSCMLLWLFLLAECFFSPSSAAGQDGVHLASVLTKDKWALGPQWFTLAARGFQNSKLFFITAMWYEVSCSRCSNIYYSRLWSGKFIKFPHLSKKSHLLERLAFCLCQLKVCSPETRKRVGFSVV